MIFDLYSAVGKNEIRSGQSVVIHNYLDQPAAVLCQAPDEAVGEVLSSVLLAQKALRKLPYQIILELLYQTAQNWMVSEEQIRNAVALTGTARNFIRSSVDDMRRWAMNSGKYYLARRIDPNDYAGTAPVVAVLPANSSQEVLWVAGHALMTRNPIIIRPSMRAACAYTAGLLVSSYGHAVEQLGLPDILQAGMSSLILNRDYASRLAQDGWNYVMFGEGDSVEKLSQELQSHCNPRATVQYGDNFAVSVVHHDADLQPVSTELLDSISLNAGNECLATKVVYAHQDIAKHLHTIMVAQLHSYRAGDPFLGENIGFVLPQNARYIVSQVKSVLGDMDGLLYSDADIPTVHTSIPEVHQYAPALNLPGPISFFRTYFDEDHLLKLLKKDRVYNQAARHIAASIYTESNGVFNRLSAHIEKNCHLVRHNQPTHIFDPYGRILHQNVELFQRLGKNIGTKRRLVSNLDV